MTISNKKLTLIVLLILSIILLISNPSEKYHRDSIKEKFLISLNEKLKNTPVTNEYEKLGRELGVTMATSFITTMTESVISRNNWLLFSTTIITIKGKQSTIGFGILGHVYLSSKVDEALQEELTK